MHYKNGRPVNVGDWVVGKTHNSKDVVVGIVLEMMPKQGPCNIKIHRWEEDLMIDDADTVRTPAHKTSGVVDYADASEFILASDGLKMVKAVIGFGNWDAPYLS